MEKPNSTIEPVVKFVKIDRINRIFTGLNRIMQLTRKQAQEFRERWRMANDRINQEILNTPPEVKLRQLAALFEAVKLLGWDDSLTHEDDQVRKKWQILREAYTHAG